MTAPDKAHRIAVEAATKLVKDGDAAGLRWTDITIACETVIGIVVSCAAEMSGAPDKERWSAEIIDTMTERAHARVVALLRGMPYNGM